MAVVQIYKEIKKQLANAEKTTDNARVAPGRTFQESSYQLDHMTYLFFGFSIYSAFVFRNKQAINMEDLSRTQH